MTNTNNCDMSEHSRESRCRIGGDSSCAFRRKLAALKYSVRLAYLSTDGPNSRLSINQYLLRHKDCSGIV